MKKILCILLALFCALPLTACSGNTTKKAEDTTVPVTTTVETDIAALYGERYKIKEELPERDFDGYEFKIYVRNDPKLMEDFVAESQTGDLVNDAVYRRNMAVSERFNVKFKFNYDDSNNTTYTTTAVNSILAGDDANDLLALHGAFAFVYAKEGYLLDWNTDLPYVNLSKPWWDADASKSLSIMNKLFAMTGDISHTSIGSTFCLAFNKNLFDKYKLEYPYQSVRDGKWTFEQMEQIVKAGSLDLNGDAKISPDRDLYGLVSGSWGVPIYGFYAAGDRVISMDKEGVPSITVYTDRTVNVLSRLFSMMDNNKCYLSDSETPYEGNIFKEGRAMLTEAGMGTLVTLRDMKDDVGILPFPKFDESIADYSSLVDAGQNVLSVPVTASEPERTSIILEALCAEGYREVVPVFFEEALQTKYARDNDSADMLEIIRDTRIFDYGYYDASINAELSYIGRSLYLADSHDFASFYAKREKEANRNLKKLIKQYEE